MGVSMQLAVSTVLDHAEATERRSPASYSRHFQGPRALLIAACVLGSGPLAGEARADVIRYYFDNVAAIDQYLPAGSPQDPVAIAPGRVGFIQFNVAPFVNPGIDFSVSAMDPGPLPSWTGLGVNAFQFNFGGINLTLNDLVAAGSPADFRWELAVTIPPDPNPLNPTSFPSTFNLMLDDTGSGGNRFELTLGGGPVANSVLARYEAEGVRWDSLMGVNVNLCVPGDNPLGSDPASAPGFPCTSQLVSGPAAGQSVALLSGPFLIIPEPASLALLGAGIVGLAAVARRTTAKPSRSA